MTVTDRDAIGFTAWDIQDPYDPAATSEHLEGSLAGFHPCTPRYGKDYMKKLQDEHDEIVDKALVDMFESRDPEFRARVARMSRVVGDQVADLVYGKPAHEAAEFLADIREKIAATWPELYQVGTLARQLAIVEADVLHALVVAAVTDSDELRAAARQFVADGGTVPRRKRNRNRAKNRNRNRGRNRTRGRTRKESSNESGNETAPDKDRRPTNGKPRTRKQSGNRNRSRARKGNGNGNGNGTGKSGNRNQPESGSAAETGKGKQTGTGNSRNQSSKPNRKRNRNRSRARKGNGNGNGNGKSGNQPESGSAAETGSTKQTGNGNSRNQSANRNRNGNAGNSRKRSRNRSRSRNSNGTAPAKGASARS